MATARDALMFYEGAQDANPVELLTTTDNKVFSSTIKPWSNFLDGATDARPQILMDGLKTGGGISPGAADQVAVAAGTANLGGAEITFPAAGAVAVARPVTDTHLIYSISVDALGTITATGGVEGTSFSSVQGVAGGPPLILAGEIQLGLVRLSAQASAVILASEIQTGGLFTELADSPAIQNIDLANGVVTLQAALPTSHVGSVTRAVHASYSTPVFFQFSRVLDFVPANKTGTSNTETFYDQVTVSSVTVGQGNATFTVGVDDGVGDDVNRLEGLTIWTKYQPNKNDGNHKLTIGPVFWTEENPIDAQIKFSVTQIAEQATVNVVV